MSSTKAIEIAADLISVLHKVDPLVHVSKQNERLHHVQAGNQDGSVKEGGAHEVTARPLMGFQAVADG